MICFVVINNLFNINIVSFSNSWMGNIHQFSTYLIHLLKTFVIDMMTINLQDYLVFFFTIYLIFFMIFYIKHFCKEMIQKLTFKNHIFCTLFLFYLISAVFVCTSQIFINLEILFFNYLFELVVYLYNFFDAHCYFFKFIILDVNN